MKEKKDCKIVQDLLPTYLEKLTNRETAQYIEEHLKNCDSCTKIYENMKMSNSNTEIPEKEVNYLKKYKTKLKFFKGIVFLVIIAFMVHVGRNMMILHTLQTNYEKYAKLTNYYQKTYTYHGDSVHVIEKYRKGDQYFFKEGNDLVSILTYYKGETVNQYTQTEEVKLANLNLPYEEPGHFFNYLQMKHFGDFLWKSVLASIRSEECNGKQCYRIIMNVPQDSNYFISSDAILYLAKETGMPIRITYSVNGQYADTVQDYKYSFNTVTDRMFVEPDISEYEIMEESINLVY